MLLGNALVTYFKKDVNQNKWLSSLDVELIFSYVLQCRREDLYVRWDTKCGQSILKQCQFFIDQRKTGRPMAYILKKKEFYRHLFDISPQVFIPRPETETLVTATHSVLKNQLDRNWTIVDFGCGCGCVGLSLLDLFPNACLIGVDINGEALKLSQKNAHNLGLSHRSFFIKKEVENLSLRDINLFNKSDVYIIVANPPYIAFNDPLIEKSVVDFEPPSALFSSEQGLEHIRRWFKKASEILIPGGYYFFEIGNHPAQTLHKYLSKDLIWKRSFKDLSGCQRIMSFQKHHNG